MIIAVFIALFLLAVLGLATDYTQVWAHRQMAQGAADAACQAGAADVFLKGTDPTATTDFPALDFSDCPSRSDLYKVASKFNAVRCEWWTCTRSVIFSISRVNSVIAWRIF